MKTVIFVIYGWKMQPSRYLGIEELGPTIGIGASTTKLGLFSGCGYHLVIYNQVTI